MSGHVGQPVAGDTAVYDQLRACHDEILMFLARRASTPMQPDIHALARDYAGALIDVYGILSRVNMIFLQLEQANG